MSLFWKPNKRSKILTTTFKSNKVIISNAGWKRLHLKKIFPLKVKLIERLLRTLKLKKKKVFTKCLNNYKIIFNFFYDFYKKNYILILNISLKHEKQYKKLFIANKNSIKIFFPVYECWGGVVPLGSMGGGWSSKVERMVTGYKFFLKTLLDEKSKSIDYFDWELTYSQYLKRFKIKPRVKRGKNFWLKEVIKDEKSKFSNFLEQQQDINFLNTNFVQTLYFSRAIIKKGLVLINGIQIKNPQFFLKKGDFLTVIDIFKYFIFFNLRKRLFVNLWANILKIENNFIKPFNFLFSNNMEINYKLIVAFIITTKIQNNFNILIRYIKIIR